MRLKQLVLAAALIAAPTLASGLTLQPTRTVDFTASEGTWMQPDVSPDGGTILFDLLGDIYAVAAAGGPARPLLTGMAWERSPVFSPDGAKIAFLSDRSGTDNLWIADADGSHPRQLSHDGALNVLAAPAWAPDGRSVYVSRMKHDVLAFELWRFGTEDGGNFQVTKAQPAGTEGWDDRKNALGAAPSPDGRFVYFSAKTGTTWTQKDLPHWSIVRRDLATGEEVMIVAGQGAAMHPAISHDGRWLAYASRSGPQTGLRLRDLQSGADRWIAFPIDPDGQDQGYYDNLTPRFSFERGDRTILMSVGGHLRRLDIAAGRFADVPFTARVQQALGPLTRVSQRDETGPVHARIIQGASEAPDDRRIAFTALGRLYIQNLGENGAPKAIAGAPFLSYQPAWSRDGRRLAFVTWSPQAGGAVWTIPATGGTPHRVTGVPAYYTEPVWSPDGRTLAVLRASGYDRLRSESETNADRPTDIVLLPASGGDARLVLHTNGARLLDWASERLRYYGPGGVSSVRLDGSDLRPELVVKATPWSYYVKDAEPVEAVRLSPDGTRALALAGGQVWLVDVPPPNGRTAPQVDLTKPALGAIKLTRIGADEVGWSADGRAIGWSLGAHWRRLPLSAARDDGEAAAEDHLADVAVPRDVPPGAIVLRGGTVITMRGDEVIAGADVVVVGDRIAAVGRVGQVRIPSGAAIRDVTGKYLIPGFVDTHTHSFELRRSIQELNGSNFLANLAYGVTSSLDPQAFTPDMFVYQDLIDAGLMLGPRSYSVGRGVFHNSDLSSEASAEPVLLRYRDYHRTRNIKSYMVGDRSRRQAMVEAAFKLGMMPTTEGATDLVMDLTHFIDGFSGNEHALPVSPLHDDVVQLVARSRTSYTPTIGVLYGALGAYNAYAIATRIEDDPKFRRFTPPLEIAAKLRERRWEPAEEQGYARFAKDAVAIQRAGGLVGIGSHGEIQGIDYHWELAAFRSGGATPREMLRAATIGSAEVIGHQADIGSLEPGKFADMLVLDGDPLADPRYLDEIAQIMKNGRLYDAATLDELAPTPRKLPHMWWWDDAPANVPSGVAR